MRIINHLISPFPCGGPRMERGRETKNSHLGTPHNHKVFVTIWGSPYRMERGRERKISHLGAPHNHKVFVTIRGYMYVWLRCIKTTCLAVRGGCCTPRWTRCLPTRRLCLWPWPWTRYTSTLSSEELVPQRVQPGTAQAPQSIVRGGYQLIIPTYIYVMVALYQNMVA
jgi:hypothetical protein